MVDDLFSVDFGLFLARTRVQGAAGSKSTACRSGQSPAPNATASVASRHKGASNCSPSKASRRISMCHCLECQRRTGAVISNQTRFRREQDLIRGQVHAWTRRGESGKALTFHARDTQTIIALGRLLLDRVLERHKWARYAPPIGRKVQGI
jgi:glutathione-dependent formaldehyde-activating enzyme